MEEELDEIAEGKMRWVQVLDEFYGPFERLMEKKEEEIERPKEELDEECPKCIEEHRDPPGQLVIKLGRAGRFVACDRWPECDYSRDLSGRERPEPELLEERCPECGKQLLKRVGRYGPFVGCSGYPDCKYIKREEQKTGVLCPKCKEEGREPQGELVVKRARRRRGSVFYGCNRYPECDFTVGQKPLTEPCPNCGGLLVQGPKGIKCSTNGDYESQGGPTEAA
jgi:DNA topoisomerase-1